MRFRLTLLLGLAIGYVLGTKAGRTRYDQIMELWNQVMGSETVQQVSQQVSGLADQAVGTFQAKTSEGMSKASDAMASAESSSGGSAPPS